MPDSLDSSSAESLLAETFRERKESPEELFSLVYQELRQVARAYMRRERPDHTLQPTALVNEAYLKLFTVRRSSGKTESIYSARSPAACGECWSIIAGAIVPNAMAAFSVKSPSMIRDRHFSMICPSCWRWMRPWLRHKRDYSSP